MGGGQDKIALILFILSCAPFIVHFSPNSKTIYYDVSIYLSMSVS